MKQRRPPRGLSPEERALWRQVAKTVRPIEPSRLKAVEEPKPPEASDPPRPARAALKSGASGLPAEWFDGAPARKKPPVPVDRGTERRIQRGRVEVEARIDLHGLTQARARADLLAFLTRCRGRGFKTVLVITGKGAAKRALDERRFQPWRPDEPSLPGVIRRCLPRWLAEPDFAAVVSGYAGAHRRHGGEGAFYVVLRRD